MIEEEWFGPTQSEWMGFCWGWQFWMWNVSLFLDTGLQLARISPSSCCLILLSAILRSAGSPSINHTVGAEWSQVGRSGCISAHIRKPFLSTTKGLQSSCFNIHCDAFSCRVAEGVKGYAHSNVVSTFSLYTPRFPQCLFSEYCVLLILRILCSRVFFLAAHWLSDDPCVLILVTITLDSHVTNGPAHFIILQSTVAWINLCWLLPGILLWLIVFYFPQWSP